MQSSLCSLHCDLLCQVLLALCPHAPSLPLCSPAFLHKHFLGFCCLLSTGDKVEPLGLHSRTEREISAIKSSKGRGVEGTAEHRE